MHRWSKLQKRSLALVLLVLVVPSVLVGMKFIRDLGNQTGEEYISPPENQHQQQTLQLTNEELENILILQIIDETDKEATEVPESPPEPVNYPPINITKVSFGVHEEYLYVKLEFLGELPKKKEEPVTKITIGILMDKDCNYSTGWIGIDVNIGLDIEWDENGELIYGVGMIYDIPDTPNMEDEDTAMRNGKFMKLAYAGGPGTDYLIIQIPMNLLGLQSGQQVILDIHAEAESPKYHHYAFDALKNSQYNYDAPDQPYGEALKITIP